MLLNIRKEIIMEQTVTNIKDYIFETLKAHHERMKNNFIKTCIIYARYSSSNQRQVSAEEQIKYCIEFAERNGYKCIRIYADLETTGTNANRVHFLEMIEDSRKREFEICVVYKNDRFARNCYDKAIYKRKLLNNGVKINYVKEEMLNDDTPENSLIESVLDGMAEYYSRNLAREVMEKGLLPNADKCLHNGGIPPLGLGVINKQYVIIPEEAEIVRKIFDWYAKEDMGYVQIAEKLNELGYKNKLGKDFVYSSIRDTLINEKYIGTYTYNRRSSKNAEGKRNNSKNKPDEEIIRTEAAFPAIIDKETFEKVNQLIEKRKNRNATHQAQEVYLLSGIIKCGLCGCNMHGNRKRTNRNKSFHITYKCNNRDKKGTRICDNKEINKQYIERAIMHYISQMCEGGNFQITMKALEEYETKQNSGLYDEKLVEKELAKVEKKIKNVMDAISNGFDAEELQETYSILKNQKTNLKLKLETIKEAERTKIHIDEAQALRALRKIKEDINSNKPMEEYKKMFSAFVDSVEVFESYVIIALKILRMIGCNEPTNTLPQIKRPLLETNQIVVWNV